MLTIPEILAQMPPATVQDLPVDLDELIEFTRNRYPTSRGILLVRDERGWVVVLDGTVDPAHKGRQAGSRGGWLTLRLALLVAILLAERPELPVKGQ